MLSIMNQIFFNQCYRLNNPTSTSERSYVCSNTIRAVYTTPAGVAFSAKFSQL